MNIFNAYDKSYQTANKDNTFFSFLLQILSPNIFGLC